MARSINQAASIQDARKRFRTDDFENEKTPNNHRVLQRAIIPGASALDTARDRQYHRAQRQAERKEGVYRIGFSRSDVAVAVDGSTMPPFMGPR